MLKKEGLKNIVYVVSQFFTTTSPVPPVTSNWKLCKNKKNYFLSHPKTIIQSFVTQSFRTFKNLMIWEFCATIFDF